MKKRAVEWLQDEMLNGKLNMKEILEQAKEMEKKQQANSEEDLLNNLIKLNKTAIDENWKMSEVGEQFFKIFAYN